MKRYVWMFALAGCGGHSRDPVEPVAAPAPRLVPTVAEQSWYRSTADCAQGPFTLDIPVGTAKYGEAVELALRAPRRIAIHATITAGDQQLADIDDTFDASGRVGGSPDNGRCVADARERLAAQRARRAGTPGPATTPGSGSSATTPSSGAPVTSPPPPAAVAAQLEVVAPPSAVGETPVLQIQIPSGVTSIRVTWWSIEPNDLDGVAFGLSHVVSKPDVGEAAYETYLAEQEAKRIADAQRLAELHVQWQAEAELRERERAAEEDKRARARAEIELKHQREEDERRRREAEVRVHTTVKIHVETDEERRYRLEAELRARREAAEEARRDEAERRAREEQARRTQEQRMREAAEAAEKQRLHVEAVLRAAEERKQFCAAHMDDRGCWGPGGLDRKQALDRRAEQAKVYCAQHHEDARCFTDADRERIRAADQARIEIALAPPSKPTGPPPSPLAEMIPPKLSVNATWRPGYWQWVDTTWVWLAGMWRVPEQDIVAEQTTTAPDAPPPLQLETPAAQPVASAAWVAGFWQWDGARWVWIAGSWQLRPSTTVTWRAATWQPRGSVHVLVPGGWIHIGGSR